MDQVVTTAAQHGWESALLSLLVIAGMSGMGLMIRSWLARNLDALQKNEERAFERESRLAARVTQLEDSLTTKLSSIVERNADSMDKLSATIHELVTAMNTTRPCMFHADRQRAIVSDLAEQLAEKLLALIDARLSDLVKHRV